MATRVIILSEKEKFSFCGEKVTSLKTDSAGKVNGQSWVSLRSHRGYVASVTPDSCPEVQNALHSRNRLA